MADCSSVASKVLKSERAVERVPPGVADHSTLGIAAGAGLVAVHVALDNATTIIGGGGGDGTGSTRLPPVP